MMKLGSGTTGCCASFCKAPVSQSRRRSVCLSRNLRRNARIVAYKEDEGRHKLQNTAEKTAEKLPDLSIPGQGPQSNGQDISDSVRKASNPVSAAVTAIQDDYEKYDESAIKLPLWQPGFTRRREVFVGRIAMIGFFGTLIGEIWTQGLGPVAQLSLETGCSRGTIINTLDLIVASAVIGGLSPWSPTLSRKNQQDVSQRPAGPVQSVPSNVQQALGITEYGFTKANEVFVGRMAMLGFVAAVVAESALGVGPVGQVCHYFNWPVNYGIVGQGVAISVGAICVLAAGMGNWGQVRGGKDVY